MPNSNPQLSKIFEGTDWPGSASTSGGWIRAIRAGPEDFVMDKQKFYVAGHSSRGLIIRLSKFFEKPKPEPQGRDERMDF